MEGKKREVYVRWGGSITDAIKSNDAVIVVCSPGRMQKEKSIISSLLSRLKKVRSQSQNIIISSKKMEVLGAIIVRGNYEQ